ncbi:outer membrane beta-barrel protein [Gaopeijia maritima]|uniref:Outer membrane beta-barrel protein n=1 Tax=Gaopeijia maritima TaxID=3119007 RepID=A0ABU9E7C5_9BACT
MSRFRLSFAFALALAATPALAAAQTIPSPYRYIEKGQEVNLFGGAMATDAGRFGFGPGDQQLVGARYSVVVSNAFSLEGSATTSFGPRDVVNPAREEGDRIVEEAEVRLVLLEARLQFALTGRRTWHGLQPFTYVGGGVSFDTMGDQDEDFLLEERDQFDYGTRFTATVGGGFRYALSERWMLRVDGGLVLYKLGTPTGWRSAERGFVGVPEDEWVSGRSLSAGLAWRF